MENKVRSFNEFKKLLEKDTAVQQQFKADPLNAIKQFRSEPWSNDKLIYRLVVIFLSSIVVIICGGVVLVWTRNDLSNFEVPDILIATASTALGAIAGLLTPISNQLNSES